MYELLATVSTRLKFRSSRREFLTFLLMSKNWLWSSMPPPWSFLSGLTSILYTPDCMTWLRAHDELSALLRRRKSKTAKDCAETLCHKTAKVFREAETVSQTPVTNTSTVPVETAVVNKAETGSTNEKPVKKGNSASDDKARVSSVSVIVYRECNVSVV